MNTPTTTAALGCTEMRSVRVYFVLRIVALIWLSFGIAASSARAEWKVDLSRRQKTVRDADAIALDRPADGSSDDSAPDTGRHPASTVETGKRGVLGKLFDVGEPTQEMVLLNTESGFVPSSLRLRKGAHYLVHVVNVNEKEKNVSFVLDSFGEHHATYYGKIKSFRVEPKKDGVYSFQCPETSAEGRVLVYSSPSTAPSENATQIRAPAALTDERLESRP